MRHRQLLDSVAIHHLDAVACPHRQHIDQALLPPTLGRLGRRQRSERQYEQRREPSGDACHAHCQQSCPRVCVLPRLGATRIDVGLGIRCVHQHRRREKQPRQLYHSSRPITLVFNVEGPGRSGPEPVAGRGLAARATNAPEICYTTQREA